MWKVLLVEDEVFVRESIKEIIEWEKWGFQVIGEAGNGAEALRIMGKENPQLVITDIVMPEMDGLELLKRAREAGHQAKFVILTCMNELDYAIQAMEHGASSYILKLSMNVADLRKTLEKISAELKEEHQQGDVKRRQLNGEAEGLPWELEKLFLQAFESLNAERCEEMLERMWDHFRQHHISIHIVKAETERLSVTCHRIAEQSMGLIEERIAPHSYSSLLDYMKVTVHQLVQRMAERSGGLTSHPEINKIIMYVHQHYDEDITVKAMARYVTMGENYISALFRQKTGKTFIRYLHEIRINKAIDYLQTTDLPIHEIGHKVGFANDNYFIRIFKRFTKLTPSQYREQYARDQYA